MGLRQRKQIKSLVDKIPERELSAARSYLEYLRDRGEPVLRALLDAPEENEEVSAEGRQRILEGLAAIERGDVVGRKQTRRAHGR